MNDTRSHPRPPPEPKGGASDAVGSPRAMLTLHEVAEHLGVHYMTVYRWVRQGELAGFRLGSRIRVRPRDLEAFVAQRELTPVGEEGATRRNWSPHRQRLVSALEEGREWDAEEQVHTLIGDGATPARIYVDLLGPALRTIDERWAAGGLTVAHEQRATDIVHRIVARLSPRFRVRETGGTAVVLAPGGERHGVGVAMAADFVRSAGLSVHNVGVDVPLPALDAVVREVGADVVVVTATRPMDPEDIDALVAMADGVDLIFGGCAALHLEDPPEHLAVELDLPAIRTRLARSTSHRP